MKHNSTHKPRAACLSSSRRDFLKTSAAAAAGAALAQAVAARAYAAGNDVLRVGLVGCGGRGSGAAVQALNADPNVKLVAMADAFKDRLEVSLAGLQKSPLGKKVEVDGDHQFTGFDACKKLVDSGVDVVLLATSPHFRPMHLKACVDAGKHVFCEKPVAVDAPGVRAVLQTCEEAGKKNLSIVSGLCYRYQPAKREMMARVHDGAIGEIKALHCVFNIGGLWKKDRKPEWSDMEWQMRNWLYFTWLSGDFIVEQHVHSLDKMAWAMKGEYPAKVTGMGGRQARTGPEWGHIYDHFFSVFEYANGVKIFSSCRQQERCDSLVNDYLIGAKGTCIVHDHKITGETPWQFSGKELDLYQSEHNELFQSIRAGKPINNGEYMAKSTLMAIMARMSAYTGKVLTWDQALNSKEDLSPAKYEWGPLPVAPVAVPGVTVFK